MVAEIMRVYKQLIHSKSSGQKKKETLGIQTPTGSVMKTKPKNEAVKE